MTNIKDYDSDIILAFYCEGLLALYPPIRHCFFTVLCYSKFSIRKKQFHTLNVLPRMFIA